MQNDAGEFVDLYCPRKCSASNRLIHAKDHASVQLVIADVDPATGRAADTSKMYVVCGAIRRMGESDDCIVRLTKKDGILAKWCDEMVGASSSDSMGSPGDILDLDRYMRGARTPMPTNHTPAVGPGKEMLVVDAGGGPPREPRRTHTSTRARAPTPPTPNTESGSEWSGGKARTHNKRYSHDSGVSDATYNRRAKSRPSRRSSGGADAIYADAACRRVASERAGAPESGKLDTEERSSLRAFHCAWEQKLREQQAQIERMTALCERLTARAEKPPVTRGLERGVERALERGAPVRGMALSADSTSATTTSVSADPRPRSRSKHRTTRNDECRTYKIIMTKLDELNQRLQRARSPPAQRGRPHPRPRANSATPTASSKATNPNHTASATRHRLVVVERAVGGSESTPRPPLAPKDKLSNLHTVQPAHLLDIAPGPTSTPAPNIATEHVVKSESSDSGGGGAGSSEAPNAHPNCPFDLNDPITLYAQATRLRAHCSGRRERRTRSEEGGARGAGAGLCGLCRGYWRSLASHVFCCPLEQKLS